MSQPTHLLFPNLPPELRQEIYTYLSNDISTPALITSLPLTLKTFHCKHTTINLLPVHYGSFGLLYLPPTLFPEAAEYRTWLLSNAVELRIAISFHGRVNTFVQADWDKKVEAHLNKLLKQHAWLSKVSSYDIKILWDTKDGSLKSKKGKRVAGSIPRAMMESLTGMMEEGVKKRKGEVKVALVFNVISAAFDAIEGVGFGLNVFLHHGNGGAGFKKLIKEVWVAKHVDSKWHREVMGMNKPPSAQLQVTKGVVEWPYWTRGQFLMSKTSAEGNESDAVVTFGNNDGANVLFNYILELFMARN